MLSLHSNHLTSLPDRIGDHKGLYELALSYNKLTSLPESIGDLAGLQELNLSQNQLTSLPDSFKQLTSLEKLNLYNNLIQAVHIDLLPSKLPILFIERKKLRENVDEIFTPVEQCFEQTSEKMSYKYLMFKIREICRNNKSIKILVTPEYLQKYVTHDVLVREGLLPQETTTSEPGAPQPTPTTPQQCAMDVDKTTAYSSENRQDSRKK